jgi:hypothetical protein
MGLISNGTTIFDNGSMASGFGGNLNFISKATASASASIEFTSGIDSTYKEYVFYFNNIHPATDSADFQFNMSTDSGSNYNVTKTTTFFRARHREDDAVTSLDYVTGNDLAQSTSFQIIINNAGNQNDESSSGTMTLFNPSSTTFVKHFMTDINTYGQEDASYRRFVAGYGNTTSAIDAVKFQMSSGNIDSGEILLFGVS